MADFRATDNLDDYGTNSVFDGETYATEADFLAAVDLSVWDMATNCASCHIGGGLVEFDRTGTRLSMRGMARQMMPPAAEGTGQYNAYDFFVEEKFNSATGANESFVQQAPWGMPATTDFKPVRYDTEGNPVNAVMPAMMMPEGWPVSPWFQADNPWVQGGMAVAGQAMMPNVREMDCLFCHMEGYNNIISSVATQMGYLVAAPSLGSGLMNMFTFAYDPSKITQVTGPMGTTAWLKGSTLAKIKPEPPEANCRQCHIPTTMANFSDMFDKFLAASPMSYNPASPNASAINGMMMPSYDLNSPFLPPTGTSPAVYLNPAAGWLYGSGASAAGPFGIFPMALDMSKDIMATAMSGAPVGGGTPGMMGPLLYDGMDAQGNMDQNALKKATIPFPRADFFKRGDNWDGVQDDVHYNLGCAGCHFNTESLNPDLNQCDPGRGFSFMGGIENGAPTALNAPDTRSTVKRCQDCHITGKNYDGVAIQTFGAQNPTAAHTRAGLISNQVQAMQLNGAGAETAFLGNHLDIIACQTCHVKKANMAVRALDSSSGNRYPSIIGIQSQYGMMSMFTDPMPDHSMQFTPTEWKPLYMWDEREQKRLPNGDVNPAWRREIIPVNMITAALWDASIDPTIDANGDGAEAYNETAANPISILWDPQISRNMKAGMHFAPGPFATIPVGFGLPADGYASAYNPDFSFSGAFDYVGIYGGNIILTNPDEIAAYKANRVANGDAWATTQLVYYGGNPFQIEHGVARVSGTALGKGGCADCHAPNTGFFSGPYDMTGTAIPAFGSQNVPAPFAQMGMTGNENMMQRPAVDIEIAAKPVDLRTGAEAKAKNTGKVLEVKFEEKGTWDSATKTFTPAADGEYIRTTDLNRSEYLYPHPEHGATWAEYYGYTAAPDLKGNTFTSLEERIHYLESIGAAVAPQASIAVVGGSTAVSPDFAKTVKTAVQVTKDEPVTLVANQPTALGAVTYSWYCSDNGALIASGATATRTFTQLGTFLCTLTATTDTSVTRENIYVKVVPPYVAPENQPVRWVTGAGFTGNLTVTGMPTHTKITAAWGDLTATTTDVGAGNHTVAHTFNPVSSRLVDVAGVATYRYPVTVRVYNGTTQVKTISLKVDIVKP